MFTLTFVKDGIPFASIPERLPLARASILAMDLTSIARDSRSGCRYVSRHAARAMAEIGFDFDYVALSD